MKARRGGSLRTWLGRMAPVACWVALAAHADTAHAYEKQWTLGAGLGYGYAGGHALGHHGVFGAIEGSIGLSDVWTIRAEVSYALHPEAPVGHFIGGGAEIVYVLDIFEVVPYVGLGVDALTRVRGGATAVDFAGHLTLGADYLVSRTVLVGVDVRAYMLATDLGNNPAYVAALARVGFIFDM